MTQANVDILIPDTTNLYNKGKAMQKILHRASNDIRKSYMLERVIAKYKRNSNNSVAIKQPD